ncbi:hypothetical protein HY416_00970 [Candidatus Kaiserbacteria bacterium]|nr:hypothetical protein [Candidatus Kaiserbacteria bacterium]
MKKAIIIIGIVILVVLIVVLATTFWGDKDPQVPDQPVSLPVPDGPVLPPVSTPSMQIKGSNGSQIIVKDFISNGETIQDTVNPTHYILAGSLGYCLGDGSCPSGAKVSGFSIDYDRPHDLFNITLEEPLRNNRLAAERFLMERLGIDTMALCTLNYSIGATTYVNQFYEGQNLGFSSCPGSVKLP